MFLLSLLLLLLTYALSITMRALLVMATPHRTCLKYLLTSYTPPKGTGDSTPSKSPKKPRSSPAKKGAKSSKVIDENDEEMAVPSMKQEPNFSDDEDASSSA